MATIHQVKRRKLAFASPSRIYSVVVTVLLLRETLRVKPCPEVTCQQQPCSESTCPDQPSKSEQTSASDATTVPMPNINLLDVLGPANGLSVVSDIAYMAYLCVEPLNQTVLKGHPPEVVRQKRDTLLRELIGIVAGIRGAGPEISPQQTMMEILGSAGVNDPKFLLARERVAEHLGRGYTFVGDGTKQCCAKQGMPASADDVGSQEGEARCGIECVGYPSGEWMLAPLDYMATAMMTEGYCTDPPYYNEGYANHIAKVKVMNETWHWFNVDTLSEDAIIFAFQLLWEHHMVFLRQHWLGVVAMQNPFDALSINDIIYTSKPDLIVEAGTANGGSALMWASMLHLLGRGGRVVTIDPNRPDQIDWAEQRENPLDSPLWQQYVTFLQGSSIDPDIVTKVKKMASQAKTVLVLLDSNHEEGHVVEEAALMCPLASVGSYCVIQDTKMGRFNWDGPMNALRTFLAEHPEFESDRSRELLYTDHPYGYLKRTW